MQRPNLKMGHQMIDFRREAYHPLLIEEMIPLWRNHHDEISVYKDMQLSPDFKIYENAEKMGMLRIYTARHEGTLVGYQIYFVHFHPHYSETKEAVQDLLFLSKTMRIGFIGYRFIKWVDDQLFADGVAIIYQNVENTHDHSALLERLGYQEHERKFSRRINS